MADKNVQQISSLSEFARMVCETDEKLIRNGADKNECLLFRGQSNVTYQLIPSLGRHRKSSVDISIFNEERNLIEMAKYKMPEIFHNGLQPLELLALLQHHGIPTRLLDVTENAFVALYFSCCSDNDKDGEVFAFKYNDMHVDTAPIINAIADTYRISRGTAYPLELFYESAILQPYFLEQKLAHKICHKSSTEGAQWVQHCCENLLFVYAPVRSVRQQMQRGRYILFPNKISPCELSNGYCFDTIIEPISKNHKDICGHYVIPKEFKGEIIQELRLFGISRETLFADSVDIVCEEIQKSFMGKIHGR